MGLLSSSQFLSQQAILAAQISPDALQNYFNTQLAGAQATNQPNDPYVTYLQNVQGSILGLDQTYQNAFNQVQQEANQFESGPLQTTAILASGGGAAVGYSPYQTAAQSEANEQQTYLNQEQNTVTGYLNAINTFQQQAQQENATSNQTLLDVTNAAQKQQIANAQIAAQKAQQNQIAQQTATQAAVQSYQSPMLSAQAAGSSQASQANPSGQMLDKLFPQSNDAGGNTQTANNQPLDPQQQTNTVDSTPPGPGGNSNMVTPLPAINGQSNQTTK